MKCNYLSYVLLRTLGGIFIIVIILFMIWMYINHCEYHGPFTYHCMTVLTNFNAGDHNSSDELISLDVMTEKNTDISNKLTVINDFMPNTAVAHTFDKEKNAKVVKKSIAYRIFEVNRNKYTTEAKWNPNATRLLPRSVLEPKKVPEQVFNNATIQAATSPRNGDYVSQFDEAPAN